MTHITVERCKMICNQNQTSSTALLCRQQVLADDLTWQTVSVCSDSSSQPLRHSCCRCCSNCHCSFSRTLRAAHCGSLLFPNHHPDAQETLPRSDSLLKTKVLSVRVLHDSIRHPPRELHFFSSIVTSKIIKFETRQLYSLKLCIS